MTMHTDIPSRGYTGVVEVCLMDVTNAPVIAFGEPTHLHPEGVSCYEDWVYVDSVTGDTTVIPDIIPAPPEPVCWRFGLISEVSEAERGEDELNLEVVGGYLSPIQVFYKISGVGSLELYDITGKVVLRRAITAKGSEKIAIDGLSSGVYFVRVVGEGRSVVKKVLVVR
ncbi:T9SS type A sorting domain-containing protein, partial [bacterium]|nr:T9SS type A sorting domain-containing protein [bacterium]